MASAVLFYLGAGQGERAEACKQRYQPTHTVLVDGQAHTESRLDSVQQASVKRMWITHDGQPATFYHYNLAEFDGLRKASALKELFPNLKLKSSEDVETVAVHKLVGETLAEHDGNGNVLVIDIPGQELALLKALAEHKLIQRFEYIEVVTCQEAWFDGVNVTTETAAQLKEYGFKTVAATLDDDPDFPVLAVYRDAVAEENRVLKARLKQLEDAQKQLEIEKQALQEEKQKQANWAQSLKKQLEEAQQAIEAQTKELEAAQQADKAKEQELAKTKQLADEQKKQLEELKPQLEEVNKAKQAQIEKAQHLQKQFDELKPELEAASKAKLELETTNKLLESRLSEQQQKQLEQMNAMMQKLDQLQVSSSKIAEETSKQVTAAVVNSTKQLEAFMGVQQFLTTGQPSLDYHGWPISSDIAMYLLNKVQQENFDVIIEFGSGTSTVLFAKAIRQLQTGEVKPLSELKRLEGAQATQVAQYEDFAYHDLPKRVVTFEHNKTYHQKTTESLLAHQVSQFVDLVHAPLVDWQADGKRFLHYDCEDKLEELRHIFEGRIAKILVFVDGPPGNTCDQARYPAIPKILKFLAKHELHIVMDDYVRDEEKQAAARWSKLFEERGIPTEKQLLHLEKNGFSWILNRNK